jgi:tetratricopeptide (TPR) repeat protein
VTTAEPLGPLVDALPELAGVLAGDAGLSKFRLFQHVRELLSGSPMLVLVEDVHWADEATLDVLRFVGRRLAGTELMILATFRSEEVGRDHPLTVVLGDLATMPGVVRMQLPPLTGTGVHQLLEEAGSDLDADEVYLSTGGNPFYVTEVIAAGSGQVPATVRDAVLARVSGLSQPGRDVVAAAAVLGRGAAADLLARVSGQLLTAVDECLRRGVLVADGNAVSFRHELARLAVQQSLPRDQRAQVHAQALAQLIARGSGDDRQLAYHAAGCGDRAAVLRHAPVAAARAARLGAHREAAGQLDLALRHYDRPDRRRAVLLARLSYECHLTGRLERAQSCQLEAMEIYQRKGDALAVGESQRWLSRLAWMRGQAEDSRRHAAAAIAALEPLEPGRELAMACSNMAQLHMLAGETAEAVRGGTKAIDLARRLGDRETEAHALNNVGTALCMAGDVPDGLARLAQSLDLALANDAHEHVARAYNNLGHTAVASRMFADADRHLRAGIAYCAERDLDTLRLNMVALQVWLLAEQGRYAAADQCLADVLRHPDVSPITRLGAVAFSGALAARRGGDGTAALDEALRLAVHTGESPDLVPVAVARAEAAWIAGRVQDIVAEVDRVWPAAVTNPLPWDLGELSWWLQAAGEHRQAPIPLARPFALMLAGEHSAAAGQWRALGCHAQVLAGLRAFDAVWPARPGDRAVSYLPMAHIAERGFGHYRAVLTGTQVTTLADPRQLPAALRDARPTIFAGVPRVWEKLKAAAETMLAAQPGPAAADEQALSRVRAALGLDQIRAAFCGAAPIAPQILGFLHKLGIPVAEVWGMSECLIGTANPPGAIRIGTVGPPLPGTEVMLARDGELLLRGPSVMRGYHHDPAGTASALDPGGWLHTGDLAGVDTDGYVTITGRKKEIIITAAGKNISPASIEGAVLAGCPLIAHAVAVGDRRPYLTALIVLDPDAAAAFAARHGITDPAPAALAAHPAVRAAVAAAVETANRRLSRVEQIKRHAILPVFWEPGGEEITPTMKLKRGPITARYAQVIDTLYTRAGQPAHALDAWAVPTRP